ncbi:TolC family outer membrane protein [Litorivicinus lipolyticus]|uniref:TolC family outer membrane protein n=1 Tax=Litorivicinus lipolyticus TaxID=418701 RepID=A0A5Q2QI88_9GAMM|nr:TolC family outer membrane protein [Litorivicinus lipolyticus]QGG80745.1 TolC family outer membrane protein [Litorivicinus lipolyticus]
MKKLLAIAISITLSGGAMATTLTDAVSEALASHPDLQAARAGSRASEQDINVAKGGLRPRLDLNAGVGRERTNSRGTGFDNVSLPRKELGLNLIWAIYSPVERGEVARRMGISESVAAALADVEQQVVLSAAEAYTNLWRAEQQLAIASQSRSAHETLVDQIGRRVENGVSTGSELVQAQGRLALALSNQTASMANLQDARSNYHRVIGVIPEQNINMPVMQWTRPATLNAAVDRAFENHPVIAEGQADIREAMGQLKVADAANLPQFTVELGTNRNENIAGVEGGNRNQLAMLRMNWNLYAGGANGAGARAGEDRLAQAQHLLNDAQREVVDATHQSWHAYTSTTQQLNYLGRYVDAAAQSREAYAQQFTINRRSLLEVLDAEVELFDARAALVNAQADNIVADHQLAASQGDLVAVLELR